MLARIIIGWDDSVHKMSDEGARAGGRPKSSAARIRIGSVIGGHVWLTDSVPPGSGINQARTRDP